MAFYNELFVENDQGTLDHIGSSKGSDTPFYFEKVKTLKDWHTALVNLEEENGFYKHEEELYFPWKKYTTSDHLIVLRKNSKKWWEFLKPSYMVWVSIHGLEEDFQSYFVPADIWRGDIEYNSKDIIILKIPVV